jgi:chromosome partitioning protein
MSAAELLAPRRSLKRKMIVVTSNKGGTGKTTTTINLLCAAAHDGWKACAVDLDTQHSVERWNMRRTKFSALLPETPVFAQKLAFYDLALRQSEQYEVVLVDTPPGVAENMSAIVDMVEQADFVIVPVQASVLDVETTVPWIEAIQRTKDPNKVAFLLNRVNSRSSEARDVTSYLVSKGRVCPVHVRDLTNIARTLKSGRAAVDAANDEKGKQDFVDVWNWVMREIGR